MKRIAGAYQPGVTFTTLESDPLAKAMKAFGRYRFPFGARAAWRSGWSISSVTTFAELGPVAVKVTLPAPRVAASAMGLPNEVEREYSGCADKGGRNKQEPRGSRREVRGVRDGVVVILTLAQVCETVVPILSGRCGPKVNCL